MLKLCGFIQVYEPQLYEEVVSFVEEINRRSFGDEKLYQIYPFVKEIYSFTKLKEIKDNDSELFDAIFSKYIHNL